VLSPSPIKKIEVKLPSILLFLKKEETMQWAKLDYCSGGPFDFIIFLTLFSNFGRGSIT
jgi:hypothetical protein